MKRVGEGGQVGGAKYSVHDRKWDGIKVVSYSQAMV